MRSQKPALNVRRPRPAPKPPAKALDPLKEAMAALRRAMVSIGVFSLVMSVLLLILPIYMSQVYDRVLASGSISTLLMLTIIAISALALASLLEGLRQALLARIGARLEAKLGGPLLHAAILNTAKGDASEIQALRDVGTLRNFVAGGALATFFELPLAPFFILIVFLIHPWLGFANLAAAGLLFLLTLLNQRWSDKPLKDGAKHSMLALMLAQAYVRNSDTVQAMGLHPETISAWGRENAQNMDLQLKASERQALIAAISKFIRLGLQVALLGIGAALTLNHQITAGMIFASNIIGGRALQPVEGVIAAWRQIVSVREAYGRIRAALDQAGPVSQNLSLPAPQGRVSAEGFFYVPKGQQKPILNNVNFDIPPGTFLGIVGPSGAGKSTLARAIVGAIPASAGRISVDGASLKQWNRDDLGQYVGYMPQHPEFFPGSISQNIARMHENAPDEAIIAAAQAAGVHDMIIKLPQGYGTWLGFAGLELSGGQKQRLGLARAFFGNPRILVLDEPNANLDPEGEDALTRALDVARQRGVTTIVVAQRPAAILKADMVMVMQEGHVLAVGPRDEILPKILPMQRPVSATGARIVPAGFGAKP